VVASISNRYVYLRAGSVDASSTDQPFAGGLCPRAVPGMVGSRPEPSSSLTAAG
jgi:hypothetical protein